MIWMERSCVYFDETAIVESLIDKTTWFENSRAHMAILASSYSDDVIAFEVKKIQKSLSEFSNFLRWNSLRFVREVIPY